MKDEEMVFFNEQGNDLFELTEEQKILCTLSDAIDIVKQQTKREEELVLKQIEQGDEEKIKQARKNYTLAYIKNAFRYLANKLKYDTQSKKYLIGLPKEQLKQQYNNYINLKRCVLEDVGVCAQFSIYLNIIVMSAESGIAFYGLPIQSEILSTKILLCKNNYSREFGKCDPHSFNNFIINGEPYYCDVSMGVSHKSQMDEFCLVSKEEDLQKAYWLYDHKNKIYTTVARSHIEGGGSLSQMYELLDRFDKNKKVVPFTYSGFKESAADGFTDK